MPAATPKREAVRLRMLDVTCGCQYAGSDSAGVSRKMRGTEDGMRRAGEGRMEGVEGVGGGVGVEVCRRTCVLCWTLDATMGLICSSRSSAVAMAAMVRLYRRAAELGGGPWCRLG